MNIFGRFVALIFMGAALVSMSGAQDLKPDEIVAKHLDAIGTREKRDAVKSLMALGLSEFEARSPLVKGGGKAIVVSNADNLFFVISLNSKEYPFEKIGYFDGKVSLPFISAGTRSFLGVFLNEHSKILSEGLFGGSMSLRWALRDLEQRKPVLKSAGTKKIDGRKAYALDYLPSGSGSDDFTIRLYIDAATFNHVRSEYRRQVAPKDSTFGVANQRDNAVLTLTEDFSDFRNVDGLTLPYSYRADFVSNSNSSTNQNIWGIKVAEFRVNQALAPGFFTFDPK